MSTAPVHLDVDTGVDDAIAIMLAVALDANLIGVSTVAGNVPIDAATQNTRDILAAVGRSSVPVFRGASRPLVADYRDASHVHGENGLGGVLLTPSRADEDSLAGPASIIRAADEYAGELTLVTLGPLTNLAIALNVRPAIVRQIRRLVVMGGAYFVPGNVTSHAEFNVFADPHAADQVFAASWADATLVGLDVTHQTTLARARWERIVADAAGALGIVRDMMARTFGERGMNGFYLHDPLAVAVALDPGLVGGASCSIQVVTDGEERGKTVARRSERGPRVATSVDAPRFLSLLTSAMGLPDGDHREGLARSE